MKIWYQLLIFNVSGIGLANKIIQTAKLGFRHFWTKFSKRGYSATWANLIMHSIGTHIATLKSLGPLTRTIIDEVLRSNGSENDAQMHFHGPLAFLMIALFATWLERAKKNTQNSMVPVAVFPLCKNFTISKSFLQFQISYRLGSTRCAGTSEVC